MISLDEIKRKLSQGDPPFHFNDLPDERNDNIWHEIWRAYGLTLPELSALKNARCPSKFYYTLLKLN